jgi:hypothetical protein
MFFLFTPSLQMYLLLTQPRHIFFPNLHHRSRCFPLSHNLTQTEKERERDPQFHFLNCHLD